MKEEIKRAIKEIESRLIILETVTYEQFFIELERKYLLKELAELKSLI